MHSLRPWKKEGVLSKGKVESKQSGSTGAERDAVRRGATDTPILEL
tara:strand:+ start:623 stop:760 length:138 start_codon:yes stop_codon:yes gene_type:complete